MSDTQPDGLGTASEGTAQVTAHPIVEASDFSALDFEEPVRALAKVHPHELYSAYDKAVSVATAAGEEIGSRVFGLLAAILGIQLSPSNTASVWGPMASGPGWSTAVPNMFKGEQSTILAGILNRIGHPALRARIADIVWTNDRRNGSAAKVAVEAYCECAEGLLSGKYAPYLGKAGQGLMEAVIVAHRLFQIVNTTTKKAKRPERALVTFQAVYDGSVSDAELVAFAKIAELALYYELIAASQIALDAEALAAAAKSDAPPLAVHRVWTLAAQLHERLGAQEARRRCLIGAFRQNLAMRDEAGSASAKAHWVMQSLQALRHIDGLEQEEAELEIELRRLQKASLKEMGSIPIELEISDEQEAIVAAFEKFSLSEGLRQFALLTKSRDPDALRAEALKMREIAPLMAMMSTSHLDAEGRTAALSSGAFGAGDPDDTWYRRMINQAEGLRRAHVVAARIDPARIILQSRFGLEERHFSSIVGCSPFVPEPQKPIVALGFARFFQGDFISAPHLLFPQIEPCLRQILKLNGRDPAKRRDDNTEEDLSLSGLVSRHNSDLEEILGKPIMYEIDLLFNGRPGPALRHQLAHGQIGAVECFGHDIYYANWLIFRICCLFIIAGWDSAISPYIESQM